MTTTTGAAIADDEPSTHRYRTFVIADPNDEFRVAVDPRFGFRHLDPVPTAEFLERFYGEHYMELMDAGGRAPELRRLLRGGDDRERELAWLRSTIYADVEQLLSAEGGADARRLLDIGAGTGDFLAFATEQGWEAEGIEPSKLAAGRASEAGLNVANETLEGFLAARPEREGSYDGVSMLNVLEHVPDPVGFLTLVRRLLRPGTGVLVLSVPNDFTALQAAAAEAQGLREWWVAVPDHINYFDFASLERTLEGCEFEPVARTGTFPMELLLLLGVDYVSTPSLGPAAHQRRIAFEAALPTAVRRGLYEALAAAGFGRNCVVAARRTA